MIRLIISFRSPSGLALEGVTFFGPHHSNGQQGEIFDISVSVIVEESVLLNQSGLRRIGLGQKTTNVKVEIGKTFDVNFPADIKLQPDKLYEVQFKLEVTSITKDLSSVHSS
jgi:hypothetical protein